MKRFYSKFRVFLLMLALGLSSVTFFNTLSEKWTEVKVDLPQVQSDTPILVFPYNPPFYKKFTKEDLIQNRDLSLYDIGDGFSNCFNHGFGNSEFRNCQKQQFQARNFILKHWREKKRSYIIYECSGMDSGSETYIFIEPDGNGEWHLILRSVGDFSYQNLEETKGYSVKYKRATSDDDYPFEIGTYFLLVLDENGKEADKF